MYEFNWEGKELAYKLAQTPSTGTLIPDKESSKNWDNTENLYIEGDNLEVLKLLQKSYFGKVKMIYIDPPYNTGKDFVYHDNFRDNISNYKEITSQSTKANPETNGRYHTDWLNMMYPRLKLARNLLREDGVIFISINDNEESNLTKICDEVFGQENFVVKLIWSNKEGGGSSDSKYFRIKHEYILCYAKEIEKLNVLGVKINNANRYTMSDKYIDIRGTYYLQKLGMGSIQYSKSLDYPILVPDGTYIMPIDNNNGKKACWRWSQAKFKWGLENDFVEIKKDSNGIWTVYTKQYLKCDNDGNLIERTQRPLGIIDEYSSTQAAKFLEELGLGRYFNYSKPIGLINYLIERVCQKDDLILDFFSGTSTTAHAVIQSNVSEGFNNKFIMVQLPELTKEKSEAYKAGYKNICEIGKERIRRAGDKIVSENKDKEGIENLDIGFKVFKLDYNNLNNKGDDKVYNEKLIELSNKTNIIYRQHQVYELKDMYFYTLQTEEEYIQWRCKHDILWSIETSEEFYNKLVNPIEIKILNNKKPKELKGKKKIETINKDADYKIQIFVDDEYNLYYQDNHSFPSCKSKIVNNAVETEWNSCKCWFKIKGLYERRNNHIIDILRDLNQYSEHLYPKNNVADNMALSRLYEQMVNIYLDYIHKK